jgi:hypothetical protein
MGEGLKNLVPATGVAPAGGATRGGLAIRQRWSVARKREGVLRLLRGESVEGLSRELEGRNLPTGEVARQGAFSTICQDAKITNA